MVINPFLEMRKRLKLGLLDFLEQNKNMPLRQALAIYSLKTGLKLRTIKAYYVELLEAGLIEVKDPEEVKKALRW